MPFQGCAVQLARLLIVSALLQGCVASGVPDGGTSDSGASGGGAPDDGGNEPSSLPIAVDLVAALVQLDGYSPYDTTIQTNAPGSEFGNRLLEVLEIAGYGLQQVSADQGNNYLTYGSTAAAAGSEQRIEFEMQLGYMSISRQMRLEYGQYVPTSPIILRAAPPGPIALNGSVYVERPGTPLLYPSGVRFLADDGMTLSETTFRYAWYPTGANKEHTGTNEFEPTRFLRQATERLYDRGDDSGDLGRRPTSDFDAQKSVTMRFPGMSDELLGQGNRNALETLVSYFESDRDRLTILSCAPDRSRSDSSVARSARIKSEMLTLGVAGAQIVELGCPDGTKRSVARAGVLVTLDRLRPSAASSSGGA